MSNIINGTRVFVSDFGLNSKVVVETHVDGSVMGSTHPGGIGIRHLITELELALAEVERRLAAAPAVDSPAVRIEALEKELALEKDRVKKLQLIADELRDINEAHHREKLNQGRAAGEGAESALRVVRRPWYLFWKS